MAYAPLGTGLLSGVYRADAEPPPNTLWASRQRHDRFAQTVRGQPSEVLGAVRAVAERHGATPAQVALAWVLSHREITVAISGADDETQIAENVGAVELKLTQDDLQQLDDVSQGLSILLDGTNFPPTRRGG
jgi:aryl-alcohol dehydrogenase-like predicted oxidoreductase